MKNCKILQWNEGIRLLLMGPKLSEPTKQFFALMNKLNLASEKRPCFVSVDYDYGNFIAKNGNLVFSGDDAIKPLLKYARIPLGFLLNAPAEISSQIGEGRVSATIIEKNNLFGVFETLDFLFGLSPTDTQSNSWDVTAGAASIRINYPLIGVAKTDNPFKAAKELTKDAKWKCTVLYLTEHLLETIKKASPELREFLFSYGWKQNQKALEFNSIYDNKLSHVTDACLKNGNKSGSPAYFWFFFRLLLVMKGLRPAYRPVTDDSYDHLGPFSYLLAAINTHAERSGRDSAKYHTPMIFVPSSISEAPSGAYLSICDSSPGFDGTEIAHDDKNSPHEVLSLVLETLLTNHNDEIVTLARQFHITPFAFEMIKTGRGMKGASPQKVMTKYIPHYGDGRAWHWKDPYLGSVEKPYYAFQFFKTLVGLQSK